MTTLDKKATLKKTPGYNMVKIEIETGKKMTKRRWSIDEDEKLLQMRKSHYSYLQIANELERTVRSVSHRAKALGLSQSQVHIPWDDQEVEKLKEFVAKKLPVAQVGEKLGRNKSSISNQMNKLGIKVGAVIKKEWTAADVLALKDGYAESESVRELEKRLNRPKASIVSKAHKLGLNKGKYGRHNLKEAKRNFFNYVSVYSSYVAGWLASDGSINTKSSTITITVNSRDQDTVSRVAASLGIYELSNFKKEKDGVLRTYCGFTLCAARETIKDLKKFGVYQDKKQITGPINFNESELLAFYIGFIEGDGNIYIENKGYYDLTIGMTSASTPLLANISAYIESLTGRKTAALQDCRLKNGKLSKAKRLVVSGRPAAIFAKRLTNVGVNNMPRKWSKVAKSVEALEYIENFECSSSLERTLNSFLDNLNPEIDKISCIIVNSILERGFLFKSRHDRWRQIQKCILYGWYIRGKNYVRVHRIP